ncbi:RNA polymerase sigma factor [Propionimicrobium sp. BV2F7]|uniref:RNA polymerase sigma factor n=1 Tax=Propionimicrobium sp. BV2F7 TaxID=1111131 RepID=UPI0003D79D51|nr:sigma-70 family RNA polymerase sigma factor [Propionimicrobium sp. BV2F7]ETJ97874.1 sigma-70, region 4 [Propionimicrobium sp. BV2F7]
MRVVDKQSQNKPNNDKTKKLCYEFVDGEHVEVEIEAGSQLAELIDELDAYWKRIDRANSRRDRHSSLSEFPWAGPRFTSPVDIEAEYILKEQVSEALDRLSERQRFLLCAVELDGYSFAELARAEGKDESAIRHAYNRAIKRARKILEPGRPETGAQVAYSARGPVVKDKE